MTWAWLDRTAFGRTERISVWMLCADLLDSGYEIENVLPVVAEVSRRAGRKSVARVVEGFVPALEANRLREAVARVAPPAEAMVFEGFGRADAASVFRAAARIADVRDRLAIALRASLAGPIFLAFLTAGLVYGAGKGFVPALEQLAPLESWPAEARLAALVALGFAENVMWVGAGICLAIAALAWLARNWIGSGRRVADEIMPFSLVRFVTGLSFVFSVVEAMRAGLDLDRRLFNDLASGGTRYTRDRILAIGAGMERGEQLGTAMQMTRHGFPSPELIPVIAALDGMDSWADRLGKFVDRWVARSERAVQERAMVINRLLTMGVVAIVGSGMWLLFGVLQDLIRQGF